MARRGLPWCLTPTRPPGRLSSLLHERDEIRRRTCLDGGALRPTLVVALCLLAALAGAGGVLFAVESSDWGDGSSQVIVREPLVRSSLPTTVVIAKPVVANGFAPQRIFAERSAGVVTVFSY